MRIKKILCLAFCTAMACLALVSCSESEIGSYRDNYDWTPTVVEDVVLDFYIITESSTTENAMKTVEDNINIHIDDIYHTTLNIHFVTADNYAAEISGKTSGIVLINSNSLMDSLVAGQSLVNVLPYLTNTTDYDFGTLNNQIASALMEQAKTDDDELYCVPNNHVVGSYDYVVVNKSDAMKLHFAVDEMNKMTSVNSDLTQALIGYATDNSALVSSALPYAQVSYSDYISGNYTDAVVLEVLDAPYGFRKVIEANGNICNVAKTPTVTKEEAYSSAFGILSGTEKIDRAMEIIYAINTDATLRNLLQYGVKNTNYVIDSETGHVLPNTSGDSVYKMNLIYTGDIFKALYCEADGWYKWNDVLSSEGNAQNNDSTVAQSN